MAKMLWGSVTIRALTLGLHTKKLYTAQMMSVLPQLSLASRPPPPLKGLVSFYTLHSFTPRPAAFLIQARPKVPLGSEDPQAFAACHCKSKTAASARIGSRRSTKAAEPFLRARQFECRAVRRAGAVEQQHGARIAPTCYLLGSAPASSHHPRRRRRPANGLSQSLCSGQQQQATLRTVSRAPLLARGAPPALSPHVASPREWSDHSEGEGWGLG